MNKCSFLFIHENKEGRKNVLLKTEGSGILVDTIEKIYGSAFMSSLASINLVID